MFACLRTNLSVDLNGNTVGTQYDQLNIAGNVVLDSAVLNILLGYTPAHGTEFMIIENDGAENVSGSFANTITNATTFAKSVTGRKFDIAYGNDVVLTYDLDADEGGDLKFRATNGFVGYGSRESYPFAIEGLDSDATTVVTFSDGNPGHDTIVTVTGNGNFTADLSALNDVIINVTIQATDNVNNVAGGLGTSFAFIDPIPAQVFVSYGPGYIFENETATLFGEIILVSADTDYTLEINWDDPNEPFSSSFPLESALGLSAGQVINSTTNDASLLIESVDVYSGIITFQSSHLYLDDGDSNNGNGTEYDTSYILVSISSTAGTNDTTTELYVQNTAPFLYANLTNPYLVENDSTSIVGDFFDSGVNDWHSLSVNWNDPLTPFNWEFLISPVSQLTVGQQISSTADACTLTITGVDTLTGHVSFETSSHKILDDSYFNNIQLSLFDDDGGFFTTDLDLQIQNDTPLIILNYGDLMYENTATNMDGYFFDAGRNDQHTIEVFWTSGGSGSWSAFDLAEFNALTVGQVFHSLTDDASLTVPGLESLVGTVSFSILAKPFQDDGFPGDGIEYEPVDIDVYISDDDGGSSDFRSRREVYNVGPQLSQLAVTTPIPGNNTVTLTGTFADIGILDEHQLLIDWYDTTVGTGNSEFLLPDTASLAVGQDYTSNAIDDYSVLTITSVDLNTGTVGFSVSHQYGLVWPLGNTHQIAVILHDDDNGFDSQTIQFSTNRAPVDLSLSSVSIDENSVSGAIVATVLTTDPDAGNTFAYTLVTGAGSDDNSSFSIVGNSVETAAVFDFETKSSYSIRVRTTDQGGLWFEKQFTITVTDLNDNTPVITTSATQSVAENTALVAALTATDADSVGTNPALFTITGGTDVALFEIVGGNLQFIAPKDFETDAHTYSVQVTADDGTNTSDLLITVTLTDVLEVLPTLTIESVTATEGDGLLFTVMLDHAVAGGIDVTLNSA
jgi:hypothetical protein